MRNKNNTIKCVLDQLSKRDGTVCSNTERPSYRKSADDSILLTNEKKPLNKSGEIHTDEEDLLKNNVLLHEKIPSLHLQQKSRNQVQSKVNQWKGRNEIQNLLVLVNKETIYQQRNQ